MVKLNTNRMDFFNDLCEVVRLFYGLIEIISAEETSNGDGDYISAILTEVEGGFFAQVNAHITEKTADYAYHYASEARTPLERKRHEKRCVKIATYRALGRLHGENLPWGSLTGIRPTRLLRELTEFEGEAEAMRMMRDEFDVSEEKLILAKRIGDVQKPILASQTEDDIDVYIGIPFCASKCLYCSFSSAVRTNKTDMAAYLCALKKDIDYGVKIAKKSGRVLRAMYIGGGTPTVLSENELDDLLQHVLSSYGGFGKEFTLEAGRPDTITREKLRIMKRHGVKRISINPQSMNETTLARIGRSHTVQDIIACFDMAREVGFDSINMDLICGLPGEDESAMQRTLEALLKLNPDNLTVHTLALKRSSRLIDSINETSLPPSETVENMLLLGGEAAEMLNMQPYYMYRQKYMSGNLENVGYAKKGKECIYNIDMMEDTTSILAHGAGAMTKCIYDRERRVERVPSPKDIATYIAKVDMLAEEKAKLFT